MARSQASTTKKEKEKQRLQKRKEKEQRKQERKANSLEGKPLEDMMAYVDENGNITSTPPDPTKKKIINTDDIVIGATKIEHIKPDTLRTGKVTFFNTSKGYGFIKDDKTQESIFVHISALTIPLKENDKVSFMTERGNRGMTAVNVKKA
jgi:cold shock CspA family protein